MSFCGDGYAFSPDQTLMTDGLDRVLGAWLQLVSDLPRPLSSKATVQKFALFNATALSVPDVLADTPRWVEGQGVWGNTACTCALECCGLRLVDSGSGRGDVPNQGKAKG